MAKAEFGEWKSRAAAALGEMELLNFPPSPPVPLGSGALARAICAAQSKFWPLRANVWREITNPRTPKSSSRTLARLHWRNKNERGSTMKIKKPFNGLTSGEHQRLTEIRMLAQVDLVTAKRAAADWVLSNKQRRVLRQAACRTIKRLPA
jgi:hypothetical protein